MKISLSQIAWEREDTEAVYALLQELEIPGIDIAPTKIWEQPLLATPEEIASERAAIEKMGFAIPGMQSIHFGYPDLQLFTTQESRDALLNHTVAMTRLASTMGVSRIVFGSPKNRQRHEMPKEQADEIASVFFRKLGDAIEGLGVIIAIEPNATAYDCDFITTAAEGLAFVQSVDHPNIRLHLDTGSMTMMEENIPEAIEMAGEFIAHFHVSSPYLEQVGEEQTRAVHESAFAALTNIGYTGWISIEMKSGVASSNIDAITKALLFTKEIYGKK